MANYYAVGRTNYFKVKDEAAYDEFFTALKKENNEIFDFTKEVDGIKLHGFGSYDSLYIEDNSVIQRLLPENEAFIYIEVGHEKLRTVDGHALVISATDMQYVSLSDLAMKAAEEAVGNSEFDTQLSY